MSYTKPALPEIVLRANTHYAGEWLAETVEAYADACVAAAIAALVPDAERYRWLKDNRVSENDDGEKCIYFWCGFEHWDNVDAAIDAAIQEEPK